jgi:hypothetical protein
MALSFVHLVADNDIIHALHTETNPEKDESDPIGEVHR